MYLDKGDFLKISFAQVNQMKKKVDELTKDKMVFKENCGVLQQELENKVTLK